MICVTFLVMAQLQLVFTLIQVQSRVSSSFRINAMAYDIFWRQEDK